MLALLVNW